MRDSMHDLDSKPKRKNDDKPKGRPRSRLFAAVILIVLFASGTALYALLRPDPVLYPQYPAALLVFTTSTEGKRFSMNLQTGTSGSLSAQPASESRAPARSPDGKWFAEWQPTGTEEEWNLILQPSDVLVPYRVLGRFFHAGRSPAWSADSQWITFTAAADITAPSTVPWMEHELWLASIETGELKRQTKQPGQESQPSFSPDGNQIVYVSNVCGSLCLYIMDLAAGESRFLNYESEHTVGDPMWWPTVGDPTWSPDGNWIAFVTKDPNDKYDVWIIRPDGSDTRNIASGGLYYSDPEWLP